MSKFEKIGIFLHPKNTSSLRPLLSHLVTWLFRKKKLVYFKLDQREQVLQTLDKSEIESIHLVSASEFIRNSDLVIALGGDGTLISLCRALSGSKIPIFGVNVGRLGFLAEFNKINIYDELINCFRGKYQEESIPLYTAHILRGKKTVFKHHFVNDAVINRSGISRPIQLMASTEREGIAQFFGDGVIVSTPTGSTAYSLAAGGPIVHPRVKAFLITPICPHGLTHRPMVIPDTSSCHLKLPRSEDHLSISLDGQITFPLKGGDVIKVKKNPRKSAILIKSSENTFFSILQEKFYLGKRA